jgi:hypothetical protein
MSATIASGQNAFPPSNGDSALRGVLGSSSLASLELLKVPAADLHVTGVVVHALGKVGGGDAAVVAPFAVVGLLGLDGRGGLGSRGAAREEAANGVADGRADCYTAVEGINVSILL